MRRKVTLAIGLICLAHVVRVEAAPIASDTFTRPNSTSLGSTETGGFSYTELRAGGGLLVPADIADLNSNQARFTGGGLGNEPAVARLSNIGFNLDVSATVTMLGDNYTASALGNGPELSFRQGLDFVDSQFGRGIIRLILYPTAVYSISVTTVSGTFAGDPNHQGVLLANEVPIGPAFLLGDIDSDGILESNEPFTLRAVVNDDKFVWFMNGQQIGPVFTLPSAAVVGVNQTDASNLLIGRTRLTAGSDLDVGWDNLVVNVSQPIPEPSSLILVALGIVGMAFRSRRRQCHSC